MNEVTVIPLASSTSTALVKAWIERERAKGLVDLKFFAHPREETTLETFSSEVMQLIDAATIEDTTVF